MTSECQTPTTKSLNFVAAAQLVCRICEIVGSQSLIEDGRITLAEHEVIEAISRHDSAPVFEWLVNGFAYQGISDRIAEDYMDRHGRIIWRDIASVMADPPNCPKLRCYW